MIEELEELWRGIPAYDGSENPLGPRIFNLHGICMHTMHDFPGYAHISGLQTAGYRACPCCGPELQSTRSISLKKMIYLGYTKYLPLDHPMRSDSLLVGNHIDERPIPTEPDGVDWQVTWFMVENGELPQERSGMTRYSILYRLKYWEVRYILFAQEVDSFKILFYSIYNVYLYCDETETSHSSYVGSNAH